MEKPSFDILFQDDHYVAINKPPGFLVHRTNIAAEVDDPNLYVLQTLRNQIKQRVYPIHRLDRPTSGVLIFGFSGEDVTALLTHFNERTIQKRYMCITRGYANEQGVIDQPLRKENSKTMQNATTLYRRYTTVELPIAVGRYPQARYSLVEANPLTGRMHQIRRHLKHVNHPILGDTKHGDRDHNRAMEAIHQITGLMLVAKELIFPHPYTQETIHLTAPYPPHFARMMSVLGWDSFIDQPLPPIVL